MSDGEFNPKVGDIVELKSGGPPMTVADVSVNLLGHTEVKCQWFFGTMETGFFDPRLLKPGQARPLEELRSMSGPPQPYGEMQNKQT